jgi:polyisoprenoid-binding protein YceI
MSLPVAAGRYAIDPVHSQLRFGVQHLGISMVYGTFEHFSGALVVGQTLADTSVTIEAEMASIVSGFAMRDEQLRGPDFLDVVPHPQMTYRSTAIAESAAGYLMTGDLTIKGLTHPVSLQVAYNGSAVFPVDNSTRHGFGATGTISRSAYGVSHWVPVVSDAVQLVLDAQFVAPASYA